MEKIMYVRKTTSQNLASGALSYTTTFSSNFQLDQIFMAASQNITETVTVTLVSKDGAAYDCVLQSTNMTTEKYFVFRPSGSCVFMTGDEIKITCTNVGGAGTVYLTIIAEPYGKQA
jgi:hypothetical protein